jgi:para-aminobenzoate synthetase / 4-amino-4-deoxychorismate lyase
MGEPSPARGPASHARFDDLAAGRALAFPAPRRVLSTDRADHVPQLLAEVERATDGGDWAYGYLAYDAAPGSPPLAWFGIGSPPVEVPPVTPPPPGAVGPTRWAPRWSAAQHARAVDDVRDRIEAGDTYQCNLTDRLETPFTGDPYALYARLATAQHGAHNAYLDLGRYAIASASPELFFEWAGDTIRTRPMKGTATRGHTAISDREQARLLRSSAKEQAENLMIVDLLRNDLARIAQLGTVAVTDLFVLEPYPTVWQMTSEITARVAPGTGLADIFAALFPCGSITGAPKASTMAIIRELEDGPRGVYCGAIGLLAPPTEPVRARFNVAIRTAVIDRHTGHAVYGAGGGITWSSDPAAERAEMLTKAAILTTGEDCHVEPRHAVRRL